MSITGPPCNDKKEIMSRVDTIKFILWLVVLAPSVVRAWRSTLPSQRGAPRRRREVVVSAFLQGFDLGAIFGNKSSVSSKTDQDSEERERLKADLLTTCQQRKVKRADVEAKIAALTPLCPTPNAATSPLLQKEWILTWTTEKEINFFLDFDIASEVSQTIDGSELGNLIAFKRGGGLSVSGTLNVPEISSIRTEFKFDTATLDLAKWGTYEFPPVGEGWFDTIYLDDDLRVDTNSRDDILICTPR